MAAPKYLPNTHQAISSYTVKLVQLWPTWNVHFWA